MAREPVIVAPSRNKILQAAWAAHKAAQRAEKKTSQPGDYEVMGGDSTMYRALHEQAKGTPGAGRMVRAMKTAKAKAPPALAYPKDNAIESEPYRRLVAAGACCWCGKEGRSQAAHPPPTGKSIKEDDRECFAMCCDGPRGYKGCHGKFDTYKLMPKEKMRPWALAQARKTRQRIAAAGDWPKGLPAYDKDKATRRASNAAHKKPRRKVARK